MGLSGKNLWGLLPHYWINGTYVGGPQSFWECYASRNTSRLAWKGQRWDKMFGCRTTKILQAGHRLIKLQTYATLQYQGPPIGQSCRYRSRGSSVGAETGSASHRQKGRNSINEPRGQSRRPETRRIIVRPWNVEDFAGWILKVIRMDDSFLFSSFWKRTVHN